MFDAIIRLSLRHTGLVVALALAVLGFGIAVASEMPVDVLPDLSAPSVTVITEARGMAPEEVEQLVTIPIEQAINGATGVRRLRSSSAVGISLVWVEFDWDVPGMYSRQVVAEKLAVARSSLPAGIEPVMAPMSSIMGEIMFVGLKGSASIDATAVRETAEWLVRRRLLGVPGVAQVVPIGGAIKQVHVVLDPDRLTQLGMDAASIQDALNGAFENTPGGFIVASDQEYLVRGIGRVTSVEAVGRVVVGRHHGVPVLLRDVADVRVGEAIRRGDASVEGTPAVTLKIQKQPQANTLELTRRIDVVLDDLQESLPKGMTLYRKGFRQADFIDLAIKNVMDVLRDGSILVTLVLILFLLNWRPTLISLAALPLSLLVGILVLRWLGASMNTMTLGGFAIAIGELVDDAIIGVENVHRRLRDNSLVPESARRPVFDIVSEASREVRGSIVFATTIILMVFAPLFFLSGLEGRLLRPLGTAYVVSIGASLIVALTVTPVLCLLLLGGTPHAVRADWAMVRWMKAGYRRILHGLVRHGAVIGVLSLAGAITATTAMFSFGRRFLPEFNEGALNIAAATAPGTSLATSIEMVGRLESFLVAHPAVASVVRQTGRAERDEHAQDVNFSELEVGLNIEEGDRERVLADIREQAARIPGLAVAVGQPISHRIEHLLSGVRAPLVLRIFGDDLDQLRALARQAEAAMKRVPGLVDVNVEQQTEIPQLAIRPRETELAAFGMTPGQLARFTEMALAGQVVGTWWEHQRSYDVILRMPDAYRASADLVGATPVHHMDGRAVPLSAVATIDRTLAPNLVNRENAQRRIVVSASVTGRDVRGAAEDVLRSVTAQVRLPPQYHVELGGEFESEARASRTILLLSLLAILGMAVLLGIAFRSARDAALVMVNLPLALMGGAAAVAMTGSILSVASLVGFITLFGVATRNGIMMVTHYRHLVVREQRTLRDAVLDGSVDRLVPILMTALTAALGLVPIVLATGEPGNEIQAPMAAVILGGLVTSTVLNLFVVPPLFTRFAR
ncbi:MAG: efflux RND transporter permease subunit [Deltaproteobacteria bacterium]|nr:efflux RND transporter permease subunit [Deltaproteobacteria bacterium]